MEQTNSMPDLTLLGMTANKLENVAILAKQAGCKVLADAISDRAKRLHHAAALVNLVEALRRVSVFQKGVAAMHKASAGAGGDLLWRPLDLEARVWALVNPE